LIPALLWSLTTFLSRSGLLFQNNLLEVKIVLCIAIWMLIQLHYFVSSFYQSGRIKIPLAYIFLIITIVLAATGYIPHSVEVTASGISVDYGPWNVVVFLAFLFIVGIKDIYSLIQRYRLSPDPAERNQIFYLLAAITSLTAFMLGSLSPRGSEFPVSHIGNLGVACVFAYAVVAHRLLDIRVVFRRALIAGVLYGSGLGIVLLVFWLAQKFGGVEPSIASLTIAIAYTPIAESYFNLSPGYTIFALWKRWATSSYH